MKTTHGRAAHLPRKGWTGDKSGGKRVGCSKRFRSRPSSDAASERPAADHCGSWSAYVGCAASVRDSRCEKYQIRGRPCPGARRRGERSRRRQKLCVLFGKAAKG